jgi:DNA polymerase-3 subunit delta
VLNAPVNIGAIPAKPIYLIYGGEIWQSNDTIEKINKIYSNLTNLKKYYFTNFLQFEQFKDNNNAEILNLDLFCDQKINKLIKINIGNAKFNKQQQEELINLINNLDQNNFIIVLIADRLEKAIFNTVWFAAINKAGVVIATKQLSKISMQKWVVDQFKQVGLTIANNALVKFVSMYQNNLLEAAQSIYKLSLVFKDMPEIVQEINLEKLESFMSDEAQFSVFDLQNALASKNVEQIIYLLNSLKKHGEEAILILWAIIKEIRNMLYKASDFKIKKQLGNLLQKAAEIDLAIKNLDTTNKINSSNNREYTWALILELCLEFRS